MYKKLLPAVFFLIASFSFAQTATAPSGSGTSGDPYLIANLDNLYWLTQNSGYWGSTKYFRQTADIDASSSNSWDSNQGFSPIGFGANYFFGTYDGNGYVISNIFINRPSSNSIGLFGQTSTSAVIKNLGLTNVSITGQAYVGGLLGSAVNATTISNCYTTGTVTSSLNGNARVGGLIGQLTGSITASTVSNCYSRATVTGYNIIGGLIGYIANSCTVDNSYSTGAVSGNSSLGGLIGYLNSGTVSNSFWDTATSGQSGSGGGTGKTTTEMNTQSTFADAGWDFTNKWSISGGSNNGYPTLQVTHLLPVELISFTASVNSSNVTLKWQTATEVNNNRFEVQRQILRSAQNDNTGWEKVGFVAGAGNSNSPKSYSFTDQPTGGTSFSYHLKQIDNDGQFKYYDAITVNLTAGQKAELIGNYPNPFNPSTAIKFYIPNNSDVTIRIYDILGREVNTLINKQSEAGYHIVFWNGMDRYGNQAASGVYLYRLSASSGAGSFSETKKMLLLK